jgi:hypothetical protein
MPSHRAFTLSVIAVAVLCAALAPTRLTAQPPTGMNRPAAQQKEQPGGSPKELDFGFGEAGHEAAQQKEQPGGSPKGPFTPGTVFMVLTVRDSGTKAEREERGQLIGKRPVAPVVKTRHFGVAGIALMRGGA